MENQMHSKCGDSTMSMEEQQIRAENARLKEEFSRLCALANKLLHQPPSEFTATSLPMGDGAMETTPNSEMIGNDSQKERSKLIDLASAAMDELIKMAEPDSHLWIKSPESGKELLNRDEYEKMHSPFNSPKPNGFVTEATRKTVLICTNTAALIETFLDVNRWSKMFSCMIAEAETLDVLSNGIDGTRNGSMQLMHAEIQLPTPLVPIREYRFIRFCKQHAEGKWAVADVSIDFDRDGPNGNPNLSCKRLPSGCILEDMPDGLSKITWVDHSQYDESAVHQIYRPLVKSGIAFGAHRWVATLKRHCESLAIPMSAVPSDDPTAISPSGKRGMLMLAQRMSDYFSSGVCPSSACKWDNILHISNTGNNDMRIMSREIQDASGENRSIMLSASTSVWMPVSRQRMFYFLRDAQRRGEWDVLSNGEPMEEMVRIAEGQGFGNSVSIIRADNAGNGNKGNFLYLQDSWTDSSGAMVVYSPISIQSFNMVMTNGEDSSFIPLLPSGFSILPDGNSSNKTMVRSDGSGSSGSCGNSGCLLTVGLQMLLISHQSSKLTNESVDTVNQLISCTIQKIKNALGVAR